MLASVVVQPNAGAAESATEPAVRGLEPTADVTASSEQLEYFYQELYATLLCEIIHRAGVLIPVPAL